MDFEQLAKIENESERVNRTYDIFNEDAITTWTLPMSSCSGSSAAADPRGITHRYHAREYENIVAHLTSGSPLLIDVREGRIPLSVILGVYESSRSGQAVCLL